MDNSSGPQAATHVSVFVASIKLGLCPSYGVRNSFRSLSVRLQTQGREAESQQQLPHPGPVNLGKARAAVFLSFAREETRIWPAPTVLLSGSFSASPISAHGVADALIRYKSGFSA